jgi:signal-transduction protein with cAMP-binding, CBS, and nucleotidyltransferase domain
MSMSTVAKIMSKQPKTVGPAVSITSAAKKMKTARIGSLFVKKGKKLVGIVTDTDIVRRGVAMSKPLGKLTVEKIMTSPICTIEGSQTVDDAQDMMADLGVRHLAVTQAGEIVGIVSVRDVLMFYKRYAQSKINPEAAYSEPKIFQD